MPAAAAIATVAATVYSANKQSKAASQAAQTQSESSAAGIAEERRQFDAIQRLLAPYTKSGTGALGAQQDLLGLSGAGKQRQAIDALQSSPQFTALTQQGENAILQNASATGNLRGGNVQGALAQFRPQLLAQLINDQYSKLGGITSIGQNAAAMTGSAGMQTGANVAQLFQQQGAALAGGALGRGAAAATMANAIPQAIGVFNGLGGKF